MTDKKEKKERPIEDIIKEKIGNFCVCMENIIKRLENEKHPHTNKAKEVFDKFIGLKNTPISVAVPILKPCVFSYEGKESEFLDFLCAKTDLDKSIFTQDEIKKFDRYIRFCVKAAKKI